MMTRGTISRPWKNTEAMTDGFRDLSFSGNGARKSLKIAAADISTSNDSCSPGDQFLPANGLLQDFERTKFHNGGFNQCIRVCRDHQNGYVRLLTSHFNEQVDSSLARHAVVADDEIEVACVERS